MSTKPVDRHVDNWGKHSGERVGRLWTNLGITSQFLAETQPEVGKTTLPPVGNKYFAT